MPGLEFEKPILELEKQIEELRKYQELKHIDVSSEIRRLEEKRDNLRKSIYANLTAWQKVQLASVSEEEE